ncbi:MAG: hypothetical protein Q9178_000802 [Gyalolechia marmorata]
MASFDGKVIAITGGASGIGQATAQLLAARGAIVSMADIQQEALTATVDSIKKSTPNATVFTKTVDVTISKDVDAWIQETVSRFGTIDGAVNLAGTTGKSTSSTLVEDVEDDDFDKIIAVNVKGVFNCMKAQIRCMKDQGGGNIVNAASVGGVKGFPTYMAYCASKHAVIGMTKTAATEYGEKNIRVNAIAPGPIDTPMTRTMYGPPGMSDASKAIVESVPMKRYGEAEEVAKVVLFLLGDESSYCTGSVVVVDGGMTA